MKNLTKVLVATIVFVGLTGCGQAISPTPQSLHIITSDETPTPSPTPVVMNLTWTPEYTQKLQKEFEDNIEVSVDKDSPLQVKAGLTNQLLGKFHIKNNLSKIAQLSTLPIDVGVGRTTYNVGQPAGLNGFKILINGSTLDYGGASYNTGAKRFNKVFAQTNSRKDLIIEIFGDTTTLLPGHTLTFGFLKNMIGADSLEDGISFTFPKADIFAPTVNIVE